MRRLLGLGEVRIERRLSFQQDTIEAKQPIGNTSECAAVRFAAPAQRGIAVAAFGVMLRGDAGPVIVDFLSLFVRPTAVYASPLSRCIRTGEILGQPHGCVPELLPDFSDMGYGARQGRTFDDIQASAPGAFAQWFQAPHLAAIPGAETLYDVAVRVARVLRMIVSRHQGETVLLVGHDSVNRIFLLLAMELPLSRYWLFRQSPCGVSFLEQSSPGDWIAVGVNETAHLGALSGLQ